ncbi:MAG TPA: A/G-specific adenine glycosylase [Thermomicrobiales bacterium]|nr:A/G-specific adenine glycosylase [Thermomicrobiales bacterium]
MSKPVSAPTRTPDDPPDADRAAKIAAVRRGLLRWFAANARDLPWRRTRDPYRVLVSEVMLQQTQVERVIPYYETFLERFPTVQALASAPTSAVIQSWAGLGYNRRAVNLQRTARAVVKEHEGAFPRSVKELQKLPGIGPYTAGAIACFAFEQDTPFIDTNMRRVLHRWFFGVDVPQPFASDRQLLAVAAATLPPGDGWRWNQALIEFGALQCTARKPACVVCPLQAECAAFPAIQGVIQTLPPGVRRKQEAPFAGSQRYFRGRVVAALRELDSAEHAAGLSLAELGPRVKPSFADADLAWLRTLVRDLERDGLAAIAEDAPAYDATNPEPSPELRVRLP